MYLWLPTRARKDPLGPDFVNHLIDNHQDLQQMVLRGHTADGKHNELEVPRAVGTIKNTGGTISQESGNSAAITAVSGFTAGGATGVATITLDSALVNSPYCVDVMVQDTACENVPFLHTVEIISATQFKVRLFKLAALAGNSWALTDATFAVAVHSKPFTDGATQLTPVFGPGAFLGASQEGLAYDKWNQFVVNQATQQANVLVGHKSTGAHNIREVARAWGKATWSDAGGAYTLAHASPNVSSLTRVGGGILKFNLAAAAFTTPMQVFAREGFNTESSDASQLTIVNFPVTQMASGGSNYVTAYIYRYNPGTLTWARADVDVDLTIHTAAT